MASVGSRLGAFAVILAAAFGTAYAVGEALPGDGRDHTSDQHDGGHGTDDTMVDSTHDTMVDSGHDDGHGDSAAELPVLPAAQHRGYRLEEHDGAYHLVAPDGTTVTEYADAHGADLHLIVVRPDLSEFHHLHPGIAADGTWALPDLGPGPWHAVFETIPASAGQPVVVATDLPGTGFSATPVPAPAPTLTVDELTVTRSGLTFTVTDAEGHTPDGLEPYLGAPAHLVVLRDGDLAFLHLHPQDGTPDGTFSFEGALPAGTYRLFLQFGHEGDVITAPFTIEVA